MSNAWSRCLRRKQDAEPGLQGTEPFSWDTSGSKHLLDEGRPNSQRRETVMEIFVQTCTTYSNKAMDILSVVPFRCCHDKLIWYGFLVMSDASPDKPAFICALELTSIG